MKKFDFHIDEKMTVWVRNYYSVDADSLEQAKERMLEEFNKPEYSGDIFDECMTLYETQEEFLVEQNDGQPTRELYYKQEMLKDNGTRKEENREGI